MFEFNESLSGTADGNARYLYSLELPNALEIPADGQYWLSIVAILDRGGGANEPEWGWVAASSANEPHAHHWINDPGNFIEQDVDASFVLFLELCADVDRDGDVDSEDFFLFLDAFAAKNLDICDRDHTTVCDSEDFFLFLDLFAEGCD